MKLVSYFCLIVIMIGCKSKQNKSNTSTETITEPIDTIKIEDRLKTEFGEVDSTKILNSLGCDAGYYAYISSEFVVKIPGLIYTEYESSKEYILTEKRMRCELLVFEKDSSHLANICTDLIIINKPRPKRRIKSTQGKIKVFMSKEEELWGNRVNSGYIKIETLEFIDTINSMRRIEIKDKYLWKVINFGTPG